MFHTHLGSLLELKQTGTVVEYTAAFWERLHPVLDLDPSLSIKSFVHQYVEGLQNDIQAAVRSRSPSSITSASSLARIREDEIGKDAAMGADKVGISDGPMPMENLTDVFPEPAAPMQCRAGHIVTTIDVGCCSALTPTTCSIDCPSSNATVDVFPKLTASAESDVDLDTVSVAALTPATCSTGGLAHGRDGQMLRPLPWPSFVAKQPSTSRSGIIESLLSVTTASCRSEFLDTMQPAQLDYLVPPAKPPDSSEGCATKFMFDSITEYPCYVMMRNQWYVPSQPRNPPAPTQGPPMCDLIRDFTPSNLMLVQLEIVEWDPGIMHWPFQHNLNLEETYTVKCLFVPAIRELMLVATQPWFQNAFNPLYKELYMVHLFSEASQSNFQTVFNGKLSMGIWYPSIQKFLPMTVAFDINLASCVNLDFKEMVQMFSADNKFLMPEKYKGLGTQFFEMCQFIAISDATILCQEFLQLTARQWDPGTVKLIAMGVLSWIGKLSGQNLVKSFSGAALALHQGSDNHGMDYILFYLILAWDMHFFNINNVQLRFSTWLKILYGGWPIGGPNCSLHGLLGQNLSLTEDKQMHMIGVVGPIKELDCSISVMTATSVRDNANMDMLEIDLILDHQQNTNVLVILDAQVQWDPGRFLSTMNGEQELNHTKGTWKMQRIGARGYRLVIGLDDLPVPWDPGIASIFVPAVPVLVKARRTPCRSWSYTLLRPEHAIAWGQAMFCGAGSVTPHVPPGPQLIDGPSHGMDWVRYWAWAAGVVRELYKGSNTEDKSRGRK